MENLEANFHEEMLSLYEKAKNECNYHADCFHQEVKEMGGLAVAREHLSSPHPRNSLYKLHKLNRLDICVEALALRQQFRGLFSEAELDVARRRLRSLNYKVEDN